MRRVEWIAFSCVHRPIHDQEAVDWLVDAIRERQPKVIVNLGDTFDAECLSKFMKEDASRLSKEYESAGEFCQAINDAAPKARKVWMMGNHEQRMFRPDFSKFSDLIDYRKHIQEARHWKHYDYVQNPKDVFSLGQVSFYHGFVAGRSGVKGESVRLGVPYGLTVSGHTHRPFPVHRISMGATPLPYWHVNPGTLIREDVDYMETKDDSLWGQGYVAGWADTKHRHAGKQEWHAELMLRKMNWDTGTYA